MSTKTISITEDAYERLKSKKKERESFSDVINRITNKKPLSDFFGILKKEDGDSLEKYIEESRKQSRILSEKRTKKLLEGMK